MTDTNATTQRNILVDFPDWANQNVTFELVTTFAASGTEGFPVKNYTLTLDANGVGAQALAVPLSDSWLYIARLPDGNSYRATLGDGADLQLTTWLASAQSTETPASLADQFAALDTFDAHVAATGTAVHGLGSAAVEDASAFDAAGSAAAAEAASLPRDGVINAQSTTYELVAGDAGKIIECNGTFTVTLPNGLDSGFQCTIINVGAGVITLAAATTLQSADAAVTLATQYKAAVVYHRGSNVWLAAGGLE